MGEKFSVDIEKLAGFGGGVEDLAGYLGKVQGLVDGEAGPKDGWEGLMSQLKGPFESTKTKTSQRYDQRQVAMYMTGNELISLANTYKEQENKTGDRIRARHHPARPRFATRWRRDDHGCAPFDRRYPGFDATQARGSRCGVDRARQGGVGGRCG